MTIRAPFGSVATINSVRVGVVPLPVPARKTVRSVTHPPKIRMPHSSANAVAAVLAVLSFVIFFFLLRYTVRTTKNA